MARRLLTAGMVLVALAGVARAEAPRQFRAPPTWRVFGEGDGACQAMTMAPDGTSSFALMHRPEFPGVLVSVINTQWAVEPLHKLPTLFRVDQGIWMSGLATTQQSDVGGEIGFMLEGEVLAEFEKALRAGHQIDFHFPDNADADVSYLLAGAAAAMDGFDRCVHGGGPPARHHAKGKKHE